MTATGTLTLTEFLLARIAEDEAVAHAVRPNEHLHVRDDRTLLPADAEAYATVGITSGRVLAECEAKRRILDVHQGSTKTDECPGCSADLMGRWITGPGEPCPVLAALAAVYADHPDYQQEWRA